jgi:hypothetical protein
LFDPLKEKNDGQAAIDLKPLKEIVKNSSAAALHNARTQCRSPACVADNTKRKREHYIVIKKQ